MTTVNNLPEGKCLLVSGRKISNNKIQLEFAEHIVSKTQRGALGLFNKSDSRFNGSGPRRAWLNGEKTDILNALKGQISEGDIDLILNAQATIDSKYQKVELNILNPTYQGKELHIAIQETTEPNVWEQNNMETVAKRTGHNGDFIVTPEGKNIFSRANVVIVEPGHKTTHTFIEGIPSCTLVNTVESLSPVFSRSFDS